MVTFTKDDAERISKEIEELISFAHMGSREAWKTLKELKIRIDWTVEKLTVK